MTSKALLTLNNFSVVYEVDPPVEAVREVSLTVHRGEIVGLAGESGCGKTTLAYGIQRLLKPPAVISSGDVIFHDESGTDIDIKSLDVPSLRRFRWDKVSMVFQGAMNALNPVKNIGTQLDDVFRTHRPSMSKSERREECERLLDIVKVGRNRYRSFPHELSGGMRQRVMIAMALALRPQLMIMDEPTTALDVLIQREILQEISELRKEFGFSVIFITHDLPLLFEISDRIAVMLSGRIVELDTPERIYRDPQHEYTRKLLGSFPSLTGVAGGFLRSESAGAGIVTTLEFSGVSKKYNVRGSGTMLALDNVSFTLTSGRTIALVGQSGSGKSTIAKILTQLETATSGSILLDGKPIPRRGPALRAYRQQVRMVFQDPYASLNPYHTIRHHLERPLLLHRVVPKDKVETEIRSLLERVRLTGDLIDRHPHELSGGQRQRVAIARALASRPSLLIADEPVSMLDVSIRLGVLNLLADIQRESNLGVLYITHDLATARHFSDEIMVLNRGVVVEYGPADEVILNPQHEYTRQLRDASPNPEALFGARATRSGSTTEGSQS